MSPAAEFHAIKTLPVVDRLKALGVSAEAIIKNGGPKLSQIERFKTSSHQRAEVGWCLQEDGELAFILPVYSQGEIIDLLAFTEDWFLAQYGNGFCLGEDEWAAPCIFDEPLVIHRHPLDWLRANCTGICILRPDRVHLELGNVPSIRVEGETHAEEIERLLMPPKPRVKIVFPKQRAAA